MAVPKKKKSIFWKHYTLSLKKKSIKFKFFSKDITNLYNKYYYFLFFKN